MSGEIVYVTSRFMTHGIERCVKCDVFSDGMVRVCSPAGENTSYVDGEHVHDTLGAAQDYVRLVLSKKIAQLDRKRSKLERLMREGAKVVDG